MIFSKKVVKKQLFWVSRFWIIQLWTGLGPKILKVSLRSTCVLKKLEHKLRNELWARRLASILSDSKFSEFFLQSITQNCQKRRILALYQITWDFDMENHIQGTTMWSLTSRRFRKCGSFWASEFLNGSYRCSKLTDCEILGPLQKIRGVKKKRHGHNNEIWGLKRIAGPPNHVRRPCYSFQTSNLVIVAVSFFLNASIPAIFFSEFDLTLTADNYGLKPLNLENYHIFGRLWTCPFTWYHPR